jgi:secreted PhoX family phosphatase
MSRHALENPRRHYRSPEELGEEASNFTDNVTMGEIISRRYSRRGVLKGALAVTAISTALSPLVVLPGRSAQARAAPMFNFKEVTAGVDDKHHVAEGYTAEVLIRWGDPLFADAPDFDPRAQTAEKQARQFGYNNDFIGLVAVPGSSDTSERALLLVNHEYTTEELMFPGMTVQDEEDFAKMTPELVGVEMMAHGGSVVEIQKVDGRWRVIKDSPFNRRITAETEMEITGPAAGHDLLKTKADPSGKRVLGMLNNCAGGVTPWGTWLSGEENFNGYFGLIIPEEGLPAVAASYATAAEQKKAEDERAAAVKARRKEIMAGLGDGALLDRYGVPGSWYAWNRWHDRFELTKEPNEANRFGWVVEIDPLDPKSTPKKRTALGRVKHEGAENIVNKDGRVVVYMGDDERFDYVYKFVTAGTYDPASREANMNLLDEGTLYVARFEDTGKGVWLPLVQGQGPLTAEKGFASQADVLIKTRLAADLLGATKMDRPEDIAPGKDGSVFVVLTNNNKRKPKDVDAANPRPDNSFGHIIRMQAPDSDYAASEFTWDILVRCGDPSIGEVGATFSPDTSKDGWFGMPDNCVIDAENRLWIATDGNSAEKTGRADGLWGITTENDAAPTSVHFFRCPVGAELCGPFFTPDTQALFVSIQHPGEGGEDWPEFGRKSTFDDPATRWPDFKDGMPPRPAVVVITKEGGGKIGV